MSLVAAAATMIEETDPGHAMASDAAMLTAAEAGHPGIRLYRWGAVCVTLGRFQDPASALISTTSVAWAHRPTGGAAVLHGCDVTLTAAVPLRVLTGAADWPGVRVVYRSLAHIAIDFLAANGVRARLAGDDADVQSGSRQHDCFASTSRNDIIDYQGKKVCGCALRITKLAALLQTSIPVSASEIEPASVIVGATRHGVTWICLTDTRIEALPSWRRLNQGPSSEEPRLA